ncbi:MAG: amino acid ABC transporter permease [Deltaproteobacteria bacterium]|nr:MAG: amino acid ABC transporter permease [Deltaproteobacteria bacterium]
MRRRKVKITPLDLFVVLLLVGAGLYLAYRMKVGLHYKWKWGVIPQYLFRFDQENNKWVANLLMQGLFTTIRLSVWATILATILGTVMGLFRVSQSLFKRLTGRTYVELIRNLPPLVLIFIFYFFVSDQIMPVLGVDEFVRSRSESTQAVLTFLFAPPSLFTAFLSALITLAVFEAAYITEIVRAGIQSIEKGQWEASYALGLSWWQQMRYIVLPQAMQRILPPLAGQLISTIKDSAVVSIISIPELTFQGMELMSATYLTFECWITIGVLYLILTLSLSLAVERLEIYMRRSEA